MLMEEPKLVWQNPLPRLHQKDGLHWLLLCSAPRTNHQCGPVFFLPPLLGTTIDFKVLPPMLSEREKLLMLSCWQQWDPTSVQGSALSQWLVGIEVEHGPDGIDSPTYLKENFNVQEAADLYQAVHLGTLEDLFAPDGPYPEVISQLALRITTYEYPLGAILAIYFLSVTGQTSGLRQ